MVVTITVFKSIVRHHYSIVTPYSYLTCTGNDVFNCDARNYLLIQISNKGSKIVYFILSISEDKDHCLILRWQWYCIKNRYHARLFTMYPMLICLSWLDISRFSHSLFPLYHILANWNQDAWSHCPYRDGSWLICYINLYTK